MIILGKMKIKIIRIKTMTRKMVMVIILVNKTMITKIKEMVMVIQMIVLIIILLKTMKQIQNQKVIKVNHQNNKAMALEKMVKEIKKYQVIE